MSMTHSVAGGSADPAHATVWLSVHLREIPDEAPPGLRDRLRAVRAADGHVVDWLPAGTGSDEASTVAGLHEWRRSWCDERAVGDRATVAAFLSWAGHRTDVSALGVLRLAKAEIAADHLPAVCWQMTRVNDLLRGGRYATDPDVAEAAHRFAYLAVSLTDIARVASHARLPLRVHIGRPQ